MPTPQRRPTAERREEIADAALRIIGARGIAALTTATLAQEVGVTTGALFRHFVSRDAILDAVAHRVEAVLRASLPADDLPPRERLERFLDARADVAARHAGLLRLMQSEQFTLALPAAAATRLRSAVTVTRAFVAAAVRDGQRAGVFRADATPEALAIIVLGALHMLAFSAATGGARSDETADVRATLRALLAAPPRRRPMQQPPKPPERKKRKP